MDRTTIIILVVLLVVVAIFIGTQIGGDSGVTGNVVNSAGSYANQFGGGGCGR